MSATHDRIIAFLRSQGGRGATDNEMSSELGISLNTLRPRRLELERKGLIDNAWECVRDGSKVWVVLKEPARPARKPMTLAKAAEPFVAKASDFLERWPHLASGCVAPITVTVGALRKLVKAAGDQ